MGLVEYSFMLSVEIDATKTFSVNKTCVKRPLADKSR